MRYLPKYGSRNTTADVWALELAPKSSLGSAVFSVGGRERERFSLAGGELVIYDCKTPQDARWAAWLGPWHMAHGMFYAPMWESQDIVETFTRVAWTDTPEGLTADAGQRFDLSMALYIQTIAGVGTLHVQTKQAGAKQIPKWRGYEAPAGEIWRLEAAPDSQTQPLLMVTDSAVVTLTPWDAPRESQPGVSVRAKGIAPEESAADFLTKIKRLAWTA
ncbi:hypothetical protein [Nonomuraea cavernae]|uniref:hypothetical protein n=1 Tax=Nonomuraea cavernae TaxID=2045107 RepID=UPI0016674F5D|nr:hypothetical protein [Nonomuraea cavernae]MCA2186375.1 hypothetical protein [Nonomuraea cavernae]